MNTLIYYSFNVLIFSVLVLIVGLIKPKWIFFWMEKPMRMAVVMIAGALFMVGAVMFGEGNKQLQQEKAQQSKQQPAAAAAEVPVTPSKPSAETPAPASIPIEAKPAQ